MTFIGFRVGFDGIIIDSTTNNIIYEELFTYRLLRGLRAQQVTFNDDGSDNQ